MLRRALSGLFALAALFPAAAHAQLHKLRVISSDSQPVLYAYITVDGGTGQITDEKGEVTLGAGKAKTLTVNVRRIGFSQFFGKVEFPDTAATITVSINRLAQDLGAIRVTAEGRAGISVPMQAFYDRWMMRQKGTLSATFIGPEELEKRNPSNITSMLRGLNGVTLARVRGQQIAMGYNGACQMAVVVDGIQQCPALGCKSEAGGAGGMMGGSRGGGKPIGDSLSLVVPIDQFLNASDVSAIEVYTRGGNMPVSLQVSDPACGVIAITTGSRKP